MTFLREQVRLNGQPIEADVFRSPELKEIEALLAVAARDRKQESLFIRWVPSVTGELIGHSPLGKPLYRSETRPLELWRFTGVGSYAEIRLVRETFGAPSDQSLQLGPASLESMLTELQSVFAEGTFRLINVSTAMLSFVFLEPSRLITAAECKFLDELNARYFATDATGTRMKQKHLSAPDGFVLGGGEG